MIPHIRWEFRGRRFQPFSLATALSMVVMVWSLTRGLAIGDLLDGAPGHVLAGVAGVAAFLLIAGWFSNRPSWHSVGMLLSAATWIGIFAVLMQDIGWSVSTALAGCWAIGAGGAWLIETDANRG